MTPEGTSLTEEAIVIQSQIIDRAMKTADTDECNLVGEVMTRIIRELTTSEAEKQQDAGKSLQKNA